MWESLDPVPFRGGVWAKRAISFAGKDLLVMRPTPLYRLQGLMSLLIGAGVTLYFSLIFALGKSLAAIMVLGVFWAFGVLLLWAGVAMLTDPWLIRFQREPPMVEITERRVLPFLWKRRAIPLQRIEGIYLRRQSRIGLLGGGCIYALELMLFDRERIEIECGGAMMKDRLLFLGERVKDIIGKPIIEVGDESRGR